MPGTNWRVWLLGAVTVAGVVAAFWAPPIPQDPAYHVFADRRTIFGIPNFWNLFSNLTFVLVGAYGLSQRSRLRSDSLRLAYSVFCLGVVFIGFGSVYYHYIPSTPTLVWDRLPMAIAFMALFSMVVRDRISERFGRAIFWPLIFAGAASVGYWHWTELQGRGDLRAYGLIQFLPLLLMPLMLLLYSGTGIRAPWLWAALGTYALAKLVELFDEAIFISTGLISGHSLKHVLASLAILWAILALVRMRR